MRDDAAVPATTIPTGAKLIALLGISTHSLTSTPESHAGKPAAAFDVYDTLLGFDSPPLFVIDIDFVPVLFGV